MLIGLLMGGVGDMLSLYLIMLFIDQKKPLI